jgi:hypothetical protein
LLASFGPFNDTNVHAGQMKGLYLLESGTDVGTSWARKSPTEQPLRTHAETHPAPEAIDQQSSSEDADDEQSQAGEPDWHRPSSQRGHRARATGAEYQIPRNVVEAVFLT